MRIAASDLVTNSYFPPSPPRHCTTLLVCTATMPVTGNVRLGLE
jgi:hypothetical protein